MKQIVYNYRLAYDMHTTSVLDGVAAAVVAVAAAAFCAPPPTDNYRCVKLLEDVHVHSTNVEAGDTRWK